MTTNTPETPADTTLPEAAAPAMQVAGQPGAADLNSILAGHGTSLDAPSAVPQKFNRDGTPAKKRGRKPGQRNTPAPEADPAVAPGTAPDAPEEKISSLAASRVAANLTINLGVIVCGPEIGRPVDDKEAKMLQIAYKDYFDTKGVPNLPPEIGLAIAVMGYFAPRLAHPTMTEKIGILWSRITARFWGKK